MSDNITGKITLVRKSIGKALPIQVVKLVIMLQPCKPDRNLCHPLLEFLRGQLLNSYSNSYSSDESNIVKLGTLSSLEIVNFKSVMLKCKAKGNHTHTKNIQSPHML